MFQSLALSIRLGTLVAAVMLAGCADTYRKAIGPHAIKFINENEGFGWGSRGLRQEILYVTENGGESWKTFKVPEWGRIANAYKTEQGIVACVGYGDEIKSTFLFVFDEEREVWTNIRLAEEPGAVSKFFSGEEQCTSLHFLDQRTGWLLIKGFGTWLTRDGGAHWEPWEAGQGWRDPKADFFDEKTGCLGRVDGRLSCTWNAGVEWHEVGAPNDVMNCTDWRNCIGVDVAMASSSHIFSAGEIATWGFENNPGFIARSLDYGNTWDVKYFNLPIKKIEFGDILSGWASGDNFDGSVFVKTAYTFLRTKDGGESWSELNTISGEIVVDFSLLPSGSGWVILRDGRLLSTKDAGDTWEQVYDFSSVARQ